MYLYFFLYISLIPVSIFSGEITHNTCNMIETRLFLWSYPDLVGLFWGPTLIT